MALNGKDDNLLNDPTTDTGDEFTLISSDLEQSDGKRVSTDQCTQTPLIQLKSLDEKSYFLDHTFSDFHNCESMTNPINRFSIPGEQNSGNEGSQEFLLSSGKDGLLIPKIEKLSRVEQELVVGQTLLCPLINQGLVKNKTDQGTQTPSFLTQLKPLNSNITTEEKTYFLERIFSDYNILESFNKRVTEQTDVIVSNNEGLGNIKTELSDVHESQIHIKSEVLSDEDAGKTSSGESLSKLQQACQKVLKRSKLHNKKKHILVCRFLEEQVHSGNSGSNQPLNGHHAQFEAENHQPTCSLILKKFSKPRKVKTIRSLQVNLIRLDYQAMKVEDKFYHTCNVCQMSFKTDSLLIEHLNTHVFNRHCKDCSVFFETTEQLEVHFQMHKKKLYNCSNCKKLFSLSISLKKHICQGQKTVERGEENNRTVHKMVKGKKDIPKVVKSKKDVAKKVKGRKPVPKVVKGEIPVEEVEKSIEPAEGVPIKKKKKYPAPPRLFCCTHCPARFSYKSHLVLHMTAHTNEKLFKCLHCEKCFNYKSVLKRHMLCHTGDGPFSCPKCEKTFFAKWSQKAHMITHTQERSHKCPKCGKMFKRASTLTSHIQIHTEEKPHPCPHCHKRFNRRNLMMHLLTHQGVTLYDCPTCNNQFRLKTNLKRHLLTHTGETPHNCPHCNKSFKYKFTLKDHLLTHMP